MSSTKVIYLLKADTNRTQDYIFESNRLPDIRGGSRQLSLLNGDVKSSKAKDSLVSLLQGQAVIYVGGGNLLARLPDEPTTQSLQRDIEALYPRETGVVTIATAYIECKTDDLNNKERFQSVLRHLETRLNYAKRAPQIIPFFERLPFARPCQACGTRPAAGFDGRPAYESFPLCHLCKKKLELGKERNYWNKHFFGDAQTVKDLKELGSFSRGEIALLYADGDGFGDYMAAASSLDDYQNRSKEIKTAIDSTIEDLASLLPSNDEGVRPVEIITVGGDDIIMFLPAQYAFTVANRLANFQLDNLSLSVGIAFGKDTTPVRLLFDTAKTLLKEGAKRKRFKDGSSEGYIDFHDTTREGFISGSLSRHRQQSQYVYKNIRMTGRPFSQTQFEHLLDNIPSMNMPASQLVSLSESINQGKERSSLYYLYQRARDNQGYFEGLETLWNGGEVKDYPWLPYTGGEADFYTLLRDVILMQKLGIS